MSRRKLNSSGSLLYVPYFPSYIDVYDTQHGQPQLRVVLSEQIKKGE